MVQLTNVPPAATSLRLAREQSFSLAVQFLLADGQAADLTDHDLTFIMAQPSYAGGTVVLQQLFTLTDPTEGWAQLDLQADDMAVAEGAYQFAVTLVTEENYSAVVVNGEVEVVSFPVPAAGPDYAGSGAPMTATLTLQENNRITLSLTNVLPPNITASVKQVESWQGAQVNVTGAYPLQHFEFELPGPGHDVGAPSYDNLPPGTVCMIHWNGTDWTVGATTVTSRPTARTDVYMHFIDGVGTSPGLPAWAISNDLYDKVT